MKPLIVKASRHHDQSIADRQFSIEQSDYEPGDFGKKYVNFSGYFGEAGPHVFAAAPELLESLEVMLEFVANVHANKAQTICYSKMDKARAIIAKAKGETK